MKKLLITLLALFVSSTLAADVTILQDFQKLGSTTGPAGIPLKLHDNGDGTWSATAYSFSSADAAVLGTSWVYPAPTGGLTNSTTAVTFVVAPSGSQRNYITSIQMSSDTLGAATEFLIRDGAGGTPIWRQKLQTTGLPFASYTFPSPLRGSLGNLLEFKASVASVTGSIFFSAQGYTAP